jgi:hypothetical protein
MGQSQSCSSQTFKFVPTYYIRIQMFVEFATFFKQVQMKIINETFMSKPFHLCRGPVDLNPRSSSPSSVRMATPTDTLPASEVDFLPKVSTQDRMWAPKFIILNRNFVGIYIRSRI